MYKNQYIPFWVLNMVRYEDFFQLHTPKNILVIKFVECIGSSNESGRNFVVVALQ